LFLTFISVLLFICFSGIPDAKAITPNPGTYYSNVTQVPVPVNDDFGPASFVSRDTTYYSYPINNKPTPDYVSLPNQWVTIYTFSQKVVSIPVERFTDLVWVEPNQVYGATAAREMGFSFVYVEAADYVLSSTYAYSVGFGVSIDWFSIGCSQSGSVNLTVAYRVGSSTSYSYGESLYQNYNVTAGENGDYFFLEKRAMFDPYAVQVVGAQYIKVNIHTEHYGFLNLKTCSAWDWALSSVVLGEQFATYRYHITGATGIFKYKWNSEHLYWEYDDVKLTNVVYF
jgi:hypothetical protein